MPRTDSSTKSRANSSGVRLGPVPAPPPAPVKTKQYEIHPAQPSHSGSGFFRLIVGGKVSVYTASVVIIASSAPAAPIKCPCIDLVELTLNS